MEYTLEDAFESLKSKKAERQKDIDELTNVISNNEVYTLNPKSTSLEDVKMKQKKLRDSLLKEIEQVQPEDYPVPRTSDLHVEVINEMEEEIHDMQKLLDSLERKLSAIQEDITYLQNKKSGLEKMQKANLDMTKTLVNKTYQKEYVTTKQIFLQVKDDLYNVIDVLFPQNNDFKKLLAKLTGAYLKGGDDVYIDITPKNLDNVNFLLEADIVQYHRNDRTKIRMTELL